MDISKTLKVGDLVELEYEGNYCATKVFDVERNTFTVDYLTSKGRPVHLTEGDRYTMLQKSHGGLMFFDVRYITRTKVGDARYTMTFTAITEPVKNQRRQAFRVPFGEEVEVLLIGAFLNKVILADTKVYGPRPQDLKKDWQKTIAKDISEDGILIHQKDPIAINSHIFVRFEIEGDKVFSNGVIRRHAYSDFALPQPDMIGVQMIELDDASVKNVRKFIMNYQIKQRLMALEEAGDL